jgi:acyl-coenzyme A thioesterase PaaI-like protein
MDEARAPDGPSVQERHAPRSICFGCGPANPLGLHLRSFRRGDALVATWQASPEHQAFPGVLNGGIVGALLDCHANWAAALALMEATGAERIPPTVTAKYAVRMHRPTPADAPIELEARVVDHEGRGAVVEASIVAGGRTTAAFRGTFVMVDPGHPGFHRWD